MFIMVQIIIIGLAAEAVLVMEILKMAELEVSAAEAEVENSEHLEVALVVLEVALL